MQVRHFAAAVVASKVLAQENCRAVFSEAPDEIRGIEHALVLAPSADGDERHLGLQELAERAPEVAIVPSWGSHIHRGCTPPLRAHPGSVVRAPMSRAITVGSRCRGRRRIVRRGAEREGNDGKDEEKAQGEAQVRERPVSLRAIDVHGRLPCRWAGKTTNAARRGSGGPLVKAGLNLKALSGQ